MCNHFKVIGSYGQHPERFVAEYFALYGESISFKIWTISTFFMQYGPEQFSEDVIVVIAYEYATYDFILVFRS